MRRQYFDFFDTLPTRSEPRTAIQSESDLDEGRLPVNCLEIKRIMASCLLEVARHGVSVDVPDGCSSPDQADRMTSSTNGGRS